MKLIIDIPEKRYEWIKRCNHHYQLSEGDVMSLLNGVKNGTLLDDVKAKIADIETYERDGYWVMTDVWKVFDNIGKAESEGE